MSSANTTGQKPAIVIVPASFTPPSLYKQVVEELDRHGYTTTVIHLLSVGSGLPSAPATMAEDADHIKSITSKLAGEGKDIIMVMHSYGGICGTESAYDIIKARRAQGGKSGGITGLLYICSPVPEVGGSVATQMGDHMPEFFSVDGDYMSVELEGCARNFFSDLPLTQGVELSRELKSHSTISFSGTLTHPAYCQLPVSYLICEEDQAVPVEVQKAAIARIEKSSGRKVDVYSCKAGHFPVMSRPSDVVRVIRQAAGERLSQDFGNPSEEQS